MRHPGRNQGKIVAANGDENAIALKLQFTGKDVDRLFKGVDTAVD